jgi:ribA/ribD-fused uncharacterized protein
MRITGNAYGGCSVVKECQMMTRGATYAGVKAWQDGSSLTWERRVELKELTRVERYPRLGSAVFSKTKEKFGGFSNMCGGFPLTVNGIEFRTSESLYQSCRYPDHPEVQRYVIDQTSPMMSKRVPNRGALTRTDWDDVRVEIMRWCLRVKLSQHLDPFGGLLWITEKRPIVEESTKDLFWGSKPTVDGFLVGSNVLGKLLMELREEFLQGDRNRFTRVEPLRIPGFLLMGVEIGVVG